MTTSEKQTMHSEPGLVGLGAVPTMLEMCWSETESACVLHGDHCWHIQLVIGPGTARVVHGTRDCCWCGVHQTTHRTDTPAHHGPLRPAALSLLDLAIDAAQRDR